MAQRNLAERALGLLPTSCGVGLMGSGATLLYMPCRFKLWKAFFTLLSSPEWNEIMATLPPDTNASGSFSKNLSHTPNSSLTAIRNA